MKTAEERAREVIEAAFDTPHNYELRQTNVGSIIRADREAVFDAVKMALYPEDCGDAMILVDDALAAVKKKVCK